MITDQQIIEAGRVLLQARKERGTGAVPAAVAGALGNISLPDDAIARGPRSVLTDQEVNDNLVALSIEVQRSDLKLGLVRKAFSLFGLA